MKLKGEFQPDIGKEGFKHFFQRTLNHLQISNFMHIWICLVYCAAIVSPGIISLTGRVWHRRVMHPNQVVAVAGAETPLHASIFTERDVFFGRHHKLDATLLGNKEGALTLLHLIWNTQAYFTDAQNHIMKERRSGSVCLHTSQSSDIQMKWKPFSMRVVILIVCRQTCSTWTCTCTYRICEVHTCYVPHMHRHRHTHTHLSMQRRIHPRVKTVWYGRENIVDP